MKNHWLKNRPTLNKQINTGFPTDDALTLQQMADNGCYLTLYHSSQFVQNEALIPIFPKEKCDLLSLEHSPILAGTMTGCVYLRGEPIQTFVHMCKGDFVFRDIKNKLRFKTKVSSAKLNIHTGEISFIWTDKPAAHSYLVCYEYNYDMEGQWGEDQ